MSSQKPISRRLSGLVLAALLLVVGIAGCGPAPAAQTAMADGNPQQQAVQAVNTKIAPKEYQAQFVDSETPHVLLDVRTPEEFAGGHIPGATNIAVQELQSRLSEVPQDQPVVVYCRSGNRSAQAAKLLGDAGYSQVYDLGGIVDWANQGYPVQ